METTTNTKSRRITSTLDTGNNTRLTISTSHDKERRRLWTSVYRSVLIDRGEYTSERTKFPDPAPIGYVVTGQHVERYSLKALESHHAAIMAQLDLDTLTTWASSSSDG